MKEKLYTTDIVWKIYVLVKYGFKAVKIDRNISADRGGSQAVAPKNRKAFKPRRWRYE